MPRVLLPFTLLLVFAGVLRLHALDAQLPQTRDADSLVVQQAEQIEQLLAGERAKLKLSPLYPHLLAHLLARVPGRLARSAPADAPLAAHLAAARHPDLTARRLLAFLSLLAVPGTYLMARRMLSSGWSLVAAAFVATSLLHVLYGRMARPHGAMTSFAVWTVAALPWALRTGGAWRIGVCSALAALTVGCLHSGLSVLPACALACVFLVADRGPRALWKVSIPLAFLGASLWLFYPFAFDPDAGLFANRPFEEDALAGQGFERILSTFRAHDPVLGVLALVGVVALLGAARRGGRFWGEERGRAALLAIGHALPYAIAIGLYAHNWHRFSIVLVPYAALLAAGGLAHLARLAPARVRPRAGVALAALALALPTYAAGRFLWLQRQPDVYELVAAWVAEHVDRAEDRCVASSLLSLPVEQDLESASRMPQWLTSPWQEYLRRVQPTWRDGGYSIRTLFIRPDLSDEPRRVTVRDVRRILKHADARWAFVVTPSGPRTAYDETPAAVEAAGGVLVERFRLFESKQLKGDRGGSDHFGDEALRFALGARGMGPSIDVFRLKD
jgi:hypothetical protein